MGTLLQVWFFRLMGAAIGKNVCLYPNGADPPMTEPDLVTIQDNACVDDASLVCHINSRVRTPPSTVSTCTAFYR